MFKKKQTNKQNKQTKNMMMAGFDPRDSGLWIPRLNAKLPEPTAVLLIIKICIYIQYGVSDHMTFDLCNPTIPISIKKTLSNA